MTQNGRSAGSRRPATIVAAAVLITAFSAVLAGLAVVFLRGPSTSSQPALPLPASSTPATTPTSTPGVPVSTPPASVSATPFRYQPLWPFTSTAAAAAWQRTYREGGQQPWHLDAEQTALSFTTDFLGFTEINKVVSSTVQKNDARIAVGHAEGVAAVLHLTRIGQGSDAPWEVVGTIDTTLSLDHPRYGATVTSPITASGLITGVDESIRLEVRQPSTPHPLGGFCCLPTGGSAHPWSTQVTFKDATDPALTLIASTGGHLHSPERFAITAIRSSR
ncbi:hypothetical protein [Kribbella monticola]|uniref:hypothetical protein n=1 Tax=Kribbella monticola TaxID=2185285 RepID=UPI0018E55487|nr:hypothetical protein [Kribbella monticola]